MWWNCTVPPEMVVMECTGRQCEKSYRVGPVGSSGNELLGSGGGIVVVNGVQEGVRDAQKSLW